MELKAIPTEFKGVIYRSRLEGDMALLLDRLRIPFEYEPRSFLLKGGVHYRPDFAIHGGLGFIEVRGYRSEDGDRQLVQFAESVFRGEHGNLTYAAIETSEWLSLYAQFYDAAPRAPTPMHRAALMDHGWEFRRCAECRAWGPFCPGRCRCVACGSTPAQDGNENWLQIEIEDGYLKYWRVDYVGDQIRSQTIRIRDLHNWSVPGEVSE